jgi:hypothetical protein
LTAWVPSAAIGHSLDLGGPGLCEGGFGPAFLVLRLGQLVAGDCAGLGQPLATTEFGAGAVEVGLSAHDLSVGLGDVGGAHGDLAAQRLLVGEIAIYLAGRLVEFGLGLVQRHLGVGRVDLHQLLALLDRLRIVGEHLDDLAGHLRGDIRRVGVDIGVVGGDVGAADSEPVDEIAEAKHQHDDGQHAEQQRAPAVRRPRRFGFGRSCGRRGIGGSRRFGCGR